MSTSERRREALTDLGYEGAGGERGLVYETTAAKILEITVHSLRKFCEPVERVQNPHYRSGPPARLYDPLDLLRVSGTAEHLAAQQRRGKRKPKDHTPAFRRRYGDPSTAIHDAAEAAWNLNRYAKHASCKPDHRDEIYDLKNQFVEKLVRAGHLVGVGEHSIEKPGYDKYCYRCGGGGCERCGFTGVWDTVPPLTLKFVVFRFEIEGTTYTWHQPDHLVTWRIPEVPHLPKGDWTPEREKEIKLKPRDFSKAKALIRWVLAELPTTDMCEEAA